MLSSECLWRAIFLTYRSIEMKTTNAAFAAIGSLLASSVTTHAFAADKPQMDMEKCYGVAKAGKNDCAGGAHACAGQSKSDNSGKEFLSLPKGTCERLVGGSLKSK
jgi:uncharacterized membrane protein